MSSSMDNTLADLAMQIVGMTDEQKHILNSLIEEYKAAPKQPSTCTMYSNVDDLRYAGLKDQLDLYIAATGNKDGITIDRIEREVSDDKEDEYGFVATRFHYDIFLTKKHPLCDAAHYMARVFVPLHQLDVTSVSEVFNYIINNASYTLRVPYVIEYMQAEGTDELRSHLIAKQIHDVGKEFAAEVLEYLDKYPLRFVLPHVGERVESLQDAISEYGE